MAWQNGTPMTTTQLPTPVNGEWDVSTYNSVSISLLMSGQGLVLIKFFPAGSANPVYEKYYTIGTGANGILITSNVYGDTMEIASVNGTLSLTNVVVYGSDRSAPRDTCVPSPLTINASLNQVYAANTKYDLQSAITVGGLAFFNIRASSGIITGTNIGSSFGFDYFDYNQNSVQFQNICNNKQFTQDAEGNWGWFGTAILPPGIINFAVSNDNAATIDSIVVFTGILPN